MRIKLSSNFEYTIEKLNIRHSTCDFDCGDDSINEFFLEKSYILVDRNITKVYVFMDNDNIIGFYSISMKDLYFEYNGEKHNYPVILIGYLGVNKGYQKRGFGHLILKKAIEKCMILSEEIGCIGIMVETYKKELAEDFYPKIGFKHIETRKRGKIILFMPFKKPLS